MKKLTLYTLATIVALTLLTSCQALFYTPNRNPVPLFKKKGDVYIDASTNFIKKADLTAGYAIANGIGTYVGYSYAGENSKYVGDSNTGGSYQKTYLGQMFNCGLGYFLTEKESKQLRFEIFADFAMGSYKNKISEGKQEFFNGNFTRIGIMPNIGYTTPNGKLSVAYSLRFSKIMFDNESYSSRNYWSSDIYRLKYRPSYNLFEHGITFRAGGEHIKFQIQAALYHNLSPNSIEETNVIPTFNGSIMMGLVINTSVFKKKE